MEEKNEVREGATEAADERLLEEDPVGLGPKDQPQPEEQIEQQKVEEEMEHNPEQEQLELQEQIAKLEEEKALLAQQLLRLKADFENYRRRMNQQQETIRLEANERLIKDLLPVLDNFERAIQVTGEEQTSNPFFQGMELIYKGLQEVLANHGVKAIEAVGQPFDPRLHEAVAMQGTGEELTVLAQLQTGYLLYDKVLRHTKVLVGQSEEDDK